ncbi:MAG: hypothetical protein P4M04_14205 [Acidobacteriota bacterium]|nr:hypothetical protein [Acidobacteriota bacterium]
MDDIAKATNVVRAAYDQLSSGRVFYGSTLDQINATQTFLNSEKLQLTRKPVTWSAWTRTWLPPIWPMPKPRAMPPCKRQARVENLSLFNYLGTQTR